MIIYIISIGHIYLFVTEWERCQGEMKVDYSLSRRTHPLVMPGSSDPSPSLRSVAPSSRMGMRSEFRSETARRLQPALTDSDFSPACVK